MLWFVFCKDDIYITAAGRVPCGGDCPVSLQPWNTIHPLPSLEDEGCSCVALDRPLLVEEAESLGLRQVSLRASFDILPSEEYQMAGKAREILYWDSTTKYCGVCGGPMEKDSDISKKCTCCGKQVWPALATAIIVRITRTVSDVDGRVIFDRTNIAEPTHEEVLMVRAHNFRGNHYGLVAGFVETGESLEECLVREVMEEVGLRVMNVRYFGSQPWPYPSGLMVGFTADYAGGELCLQRSELADGGWFRANALPVIPGKVSLARRLIDDWREKNPAQGG